LKVIYMPDEEKPDSPELTEEQLRSMRPLREVHPDLWEKLQQYKRSGMGRRHPITT
jgi:hypothetical protein